MIIRLADCPLRPWKNGLGRTREIAVHPAGAGIDDFVWRTSIAEVDSGAPFSTFPGIDRQIVLLDGAGFTMQLGTSRKHALTTPFAPFAFAGEDAVTVTLTDGPTRDFNLMVRRAQASSELQVWCEGGRHRLDEGVVLVYCAHGVIETSEGSLHAGDSWLPGVGEISLIADAVAFIICVT